MGVQNYIIFLKHLKIVRVGKNSISGENEVNISKLKRIVSRFSTLDTMRFIILNTFSPSSMICYL